MCVCVCVCVGVNSSSQQRTTKIVAKSDCSNLLSLGTLFYSFYFLDIFIINNITDHITILQTIKARQENFCADDCILTIR